MTEGNWRTKWIKNHNQKSVKIEEKKIVYTHTHTLTHTKFLCYFLSLSVSACAMRKYHSFCAYSNILCGLFSWYSFIHSLIHCFNICKFAFDARSFFCSFFFFALDSIRFDSNWYSVNKCWENKIIQRRVWRACARSYNKHQQQQHIHIPSLPSHIVCDAVKQV